MIEAADKLIVARYMMVAISLLFLCLATPVTYAQDLFGDDSLLFGEEFDLGDEFDFGGDDEGDLFGGEELESGEGELDDWLSGFEDEESAEDTLATDEDAGSDDWGFLDEEETTEDVEIVESSHPLNFRPRVENTFLQDTGITLSLSSPQYVSDPLETWYSVVDFALNVDLPWHVDLSGVHVSFATEFASFNFKNTFPAGGSFSGLSLIPMVRVEYFGVETEFGAGFYGPRGGVLAGLGYSYKFESLFFSAGYRWKWVANIEPIGDNWWAEPRFTLGVKFW